MADNPVEATKSIRACLARGNGSSASSPQDALSYLREHCVFGENREGAMIGVLLAHIWNRLEMGEHAAAQALTGVALGAVEWHERVSDCLASSDLRGRSALVHLGALAEFEHVRSGDHRGLVRFRGRVGDRSAGSSHGHEVGLRTFSRDRLHGARVLKDGESPSLRT